MKRIQLTQGKFAVVDDRDFSWLSSWTWSAAEPSPGKWYAVREEAGKRIYMHSALCWGAQVDHKDGDGLNNRRRNLRVASHAQNAWNAKTPVSNTSGFRGVSWHHSAGKWCAQIRCGTHRRYLGLFDKAEDGYRAYVAAAKQRSSDFIQL